MNDTQEQLVMWSRKAQELEAKLKTAQEWEDHYYQRALAAEKERDYYRGQLALVSDERDDITRLCAELEQRHEKAVEALRALVKVEAYGYIDLLYDEAGGVLPPLDKAIEQAREALKAIEEPTDA